MVPRARLGAAARVDDPGPQRAVDQAWRDRFEPRQRRRRRRRRAIGPAPAPAPAPAVYVAAGGGVRPAGEIVEDLVAGPGLPEPRAPRAAAGVSKRARAPGAAAGGTTRAVGIRYRGS
jgi:hypothetical protein